MTTENGKASLDLKPSQMADKRHGCADKFGREAASPQRLYVEIKEVVSHA